MNGAAHNAVLDIFSGPLTSVDLWIIIGLLGQSLFFMRFLVQWIVSEKNRKSTVPDIFWYFSLGGGVILLCYAIHRQDPVFILGQGMGLLVYIRNIMLVHRERREKAAADSTALSE